MTNHSLSAEEYLRLLQREQASKRAVPISEADLLQRLKMAPDIMKMIDKLSSKNKKQVIEELLAAARNPFSAFDPILARLANIIKTSCSPNELSIITNIPIGSLYTYHPNGMALQGACDGPTIVLHHGIMGFAHDVSRFLASFFSLNASGKLSLRVPSQNVFSDRSYRLLYSYIHFLTDASTPIGPHYINLDDDQNVLSVIFRDGIELFILAHEYGHVILGHLEEAYIAQTNSGITFVTHAHQLEYDADEWSQIRLSKLQYLSGSDDHQKKLICLGGPIALSAIHLLELTQQSFVNIRNKMNCSNIECCIEESTHPPTLKRREKVLELFKSSYQDMPFTDAVLKLFDTTAAWIIAFQD